MTEFSLAIIIFIIIIIVGIHLWQYTSYSISNVNKEEITLKNVELWVKYSHLLLLDFICIYGFMKCNILHKVIGNQLCLKVVLRIYSQDI